MNDVDPIPAPKNKFSYATEGSTPVCDLCELKLPPNPPKAEIDGHELQFCCNGCKHVYTILADGGFLKGNFKDSDVYQTALRLGIIANPEKPAPVIEITPEMLKGTQEIALLVEGMWCSACSWLIEKALSAEKGIVQVSVIFASDTVKVHFRPEQIGVAKILALIKTLGYKASRRDEMSGSRASENNALLVRMGVALFLLMNIMFFSYTLYIGYFQEIASEAKKFIPYILLLLTIPVVSWCGFPIHHKAFQSLRRARPTMEVLFSLSISSAFMFSLYALFSGSDHYYFDTAAGLTTLLLVGKYIEVSAKQKAAEGINRLYRFLPSKVRIRAKGLERFVSVDSLQIGDHFIVKPGEKIPVDGRVIRGNSEVDEAFLTGESKPVTKGPDDEVAGSSINLTGNIEVEAIRLGQDTVLSGIIRMVESALGQKSPLERTIDRISRLFIPGVVLLSLATAAFLIAGDSGFEVSLLRAITVLVIACPCALGIATPLAVAGGIGSATRKGILIRDGEVLQVAGKIDTVVFDKTGTLTTGNYTLVEEPEPSERYSEDLRIAASLEQMSNHPISIAIVMAAHDRMLVLSEPSDVKISQGLGIEGVVGGQKIIIGNETLFKRNNININDPLLEGADKARQQGYTVIYMKVANQSEATQFILGDKLKPASLEAVSQLRSAGIEVHMLSGDSVVTTAAIAREADIVRYRASALPEDKINELMGMQTGGHTVAMVGDGVNDAPALAQADVGFAVGSGTEYAIVSADVILLRDDMRLVAETVQLSKRTVRIITQNLAWAFLYNSVGMVAAIAGYLNPLLAAFAMLFSSLSVVGNSLRLRAEPGETGKLIGQLILPWREPAVD